MSKGESFHPDLIKDVLNGTIPEELKNVIKPYHKTKWKAKKPVYIGSEYYDRLKERSYKNQFLKSIARERMYRLKKELTKPNKKFIKINGNEKRILQQIKKSARHIDIQFCCEILGIKKQRFMQIQVLYNARQCTPEVYMECNKRRKNQLTTHEVFTIKNLLQDITLMSWPVTRLHLYACKRGIASASYNSWLYIKNLFEIERNPVKRYNLKDKEGIRKNQPNALIHSDVCRFVLKLNEKAYLFLSMCNYCKFRLN